MIEFSIARLHEMFTYDPETGIFRRKVSMCKNKYKAGEELTYIGKDGYLAISLNRRRMVGHRVAWAMHYGEWPKQALDHINGIRSDNRIANLRLADIWQNAANKAPPSGRREKGIRLLPNGKWQAQIQVRGKLKYLGRFTEKAEAAKAYQQASIAAYGEFSYFARPGIATNQGQP